MANSCEADAIARVCCECNIASSDDELFVSLVETDGSPIAIANCTSIPMFAIQAIIDAIPVACSAGYNHELTIDERNVTSARCYYADSLT
ncbi:hypothetical protein D3C71_1290660 [compost metagenome]